MRQGGFPTRRRCVALLAAVLPALLAGPGHAQEASVEARLREALRRSTVELRALQDGQAAMQAALDQARQQNADLTQRMQALSSQAAAKPAEPPADPLLAALREAVPALQAQNKSLRADVARLQSAYGQAAQMAQTRDTDARLLDQRLRETNGRLGQCRTQNTQLIGVANDILHLYRTPEFRAIVIGSWEPLLGFKQVELQNIVQDYEDKVLDHRYTNEAPSVASVPAGPGAADSQRPRR